MRDVFICHASEDKEAIVRPLVDAFMEAEITCWYDEAEIQWGDSIVAKIDEGLRISRYVLVVLSATFVQKPWPQKELNAALNQEASTGEVRVLPLLVGTKQEQERILSKFPLLRDKLYLSWSSGVGSIVKAMRDRLGRAGRAGCDEDLSPTQKAVPRMPMPRLPKQFTQRDKDLFLRNGFTVVKRCFQSALDELSRSDQQVETDFTPVHDLKFIAKIYVRGAIASQCKIWLGGFTSTTVIAYSEGQFRIDDDNSYNDTLSVDNDGQSLGFRPFGMWNGARGYPSKDLLTPEQAAEYLWRRFTETLG